MAYGHRTKTRTRRTGYRRRTIRRATTTRKRTTGKVTFQRRVTSIVNRTRETKHLVAQLANGNNIQGGGLANEPLNNFGFIVPNVMQSLPLFQGLTSNTRIGDNIEPTGVYLSGFVKTNEWGATNNNRFLPYDVKVLVFKYIVDKDLPQVLNIKLQSGTVPPVDVPITGDVNVEMLPFSDKYRIIAKRTLRLRPPLSRFEEPGPSPGNEFAYLNTQTSNAPFYRRFKIKVPVPKTLRYTVGAIPGTPVNCWFSVGAYIVDATGSPITQNQVPASIYMNADMYYKDA